VSSETAAVQALLAHWQTAKSDPDAQYETFAFADLLQFYWILREGRRCAHRDGVIHGTRTSQTAIGRLPRERDLVAHAQARRAGRWWPDLEVEVHSQTVIAPQTVAAGSPVALGQRKPAVPVITRELLSTGHRLRVRFTPLGWRITDSLESSEGRGVRWMSSIACLHPLSPASRDGLSVLPLAMTMAAPTPDKYGLYQRLSNGSSRPRQVSPSMDKDAPRWWLEPNTSLTVSINIKVASKLPYDNGIFTVYEGPNFAKSWRLGTQFAVPGPHHPERDGAGWCGGSV
jgi:hypothetical protein